MSTAGGTDRFAAARAALRQDSPLWQTQHLDITCDGCEAEPIIGHRFKCSVCEDIDLCGACMRALVAARIKMSQEAAPRAAPPPRAQQGGRPRRWVAKLHSRDLGAKWAALQTAVPCLHPSHKFYKIVDGPERAVVFLAGQELDSEQQQQQQQPQQPQSPPQQQQQEQQQAADSTADALAALALGGGSNGTSSEAGNATPDSSSTGGHAAPGSSSSGGGNAAPSSSGDSSGDKGSRLEQFLATFPPSACSCADVAWVCVSNDPAEQLQQQQQAGARQAAGSGSLEERVDAALEEWERLAAGSKRVTAADVDRLAAKHCILKGKWMAFARSGAEADAAWAAVARAVCAQPAPGQATAAAAAESERQAPLCGSAKCSATAPDNSWVIIAYVDNYQASRRDAEDVQRVCRGLQRAVPPGLLQDKRLLFKPDIYTHLGIYSKNEWGLKPSIFEARLP